MNFKALVPLVFLPLALANIITLDNNIESDLHRSQCASITEQTISDCLQPILTYANSIQQTSSSNGSPFSLQGGEIFEKLCELYKGFKKCTHRIRCHSISLEAVEASYGYMCGSGQKLFAKHAACFAEIERKQEYALCRNAADQAMDDALKVKNELPVYFQKLCFIMDDYLRCCRPFVVDKCGQDAWRLVYQITIDSLRVTMPNCEITNVIN